ncbi:MAG: hypothetical protein E2O91_02370 [Alphaproteobacteria bacterium]|nr:MAG: hypothetical protein E2O91_02370 [Alphaproteobacteria bacterium]
MKRQHLFIPSLISCLFLALAGPQTGMSQEDLAPPPLETIDVALEPSSAISLPQIEYYLNSIQTMRAEFVQIAPDSSLSSGTFYLQRPGRVRFEYAGDNPVLIVSNGNIVSFIDYEIDQITRWPVNETPLARLLEAEISLGENAMLYTLPSVDTTTLVAVSTTDPAKPEQGTLTMIFSRDNRIDDAPIKLIGWEVVDAQGALTTINLGEREMNIPLDDELWEFDDPRTQRFERRRRR